MSISFNQTILKEVFDEEIVRFKIGPGAPNRLKQLLDYIDNLENGQLTKQQLLWIINQINFSTSADIVAYCLQNYYDENDINESLYSSGIERTAAYFNDIPCEPTHPTHPNETKAEYIESVLFRCFSNYMIKKGYRAKDIYRCMIRFGCIYNPRSNAIVKLFNNLSSGYFLRSANLDQGSEYEFTDRNMFSGQGNAIKFTSNIVSQITSSSFTDVGGQPFLLTIDYGNLDRLDARPYAYILPTLFYMRDHRVNDFQGVKLRIIREQQDEKRRMQQQQQNLEKWMEMRMQLGTQGGERRQTRKVKATKILKKSKNITNITNLNLTNNKKIRHLRNKSRQERDRRKSKKSKK